MFRPVWNLGRNTTNLFRKTPSKIQSRDPFSSQNPYIALRVLRFIKVPNTGVQNRGGATLGVIGG